MLCQRNYNPAFVIETLYELEHRRKEEHENHFRGGVNALLANRLRRARLTREGQPYIIPGWRALCSRALFVNSYLFICCLHI